MRYLKAFKTISVILGLILGLVLAVSGCTTNKNNVTGMGISLAAEAVPEGIQLTFSHIPVETTRLFINIQYYNNTGELASVYDIISSYADLRDGSLEQVKLTRKVIFPIVQAGQKYSIAVIFQNENFEDISDWIYADCIAGGGIYLNGDLTLVLNENNSGVSLSSEPVFSSNVIFDETKYNFSVTIMVYQTESEKGSIGVGSHHIPTINGLTWVFDPHMTKSLREGDYLNSGSYPAFVTARCNIIYDNIKWLVEIVKTPEFTYSL